MEKAKRVPKNARWTKKKTAALLLLIVVVIASVVFAWLYGLFGVQVVSDYDESRLGVFFLDVGQGDSILIKSPEGRFMLIDAGTNEGGEELVNMLRSYNVETLDYFVLTHADADHVGGADDVLENFEVKTVLSSDVGADTKTWRDVLDAIEREGCADVTVSVGNRYTFSEDCTFYGSGAGGHRDRSEQLQCGAPYGLWRDLLPVHGRCGEGGGRADAPTQRQGGFAGGCAEGGAPWLLHLHECGISGSRFPFLWGNFLRKRQ